MFGSRASSRAAASSAGRASAEAPGANRTANESAPRTPNSAVASDQPTSTVSPALPGSVRSTMPATRRLAGAAAPTVNRIVAPSPSPSRSDWLRGRITVPPPSSPVSAEVRSPATNVSRPSARRSFPVIAAASSRMPWYAASNVAIGVTLATPGTAASVEPGPSSSIAAGTIEVTISSPGTTSTSHAFADRRAFWATSPTATTIASPTRSAPTVRAVRLGSRRATPRARRSSVRRIQPNGIPAIRASGGRMNGVRTVAPSRIA